MIPLRRSTKPAPDEQLKEQSARTKANALRTQEASAALAQAEAKRNAAKSALDTASPAKRSQLKAKFRSAYASYLFAKIRLIRAQGWQQGKRGNQRKEVEAFLAAERSGSPHPEVVDALKGVSGS